MWNILDHETPFVSPRVEVCREPANRPQFSLSGLMKFTAGVCVILALLTRMAVETEPMLAGCCIILGSTLVVLKIVDAAAYGEIRAYHSPAVTRGPSTRHCSSSSRGP